jgi:iron complex transport system ATP-binding protein
MIRFEEIEIGYSKTLLFIPSLTLDAGKVYALVGLNGIGKSTFLNSITGQTSLLSGKLFLNQQELQKISKVNLPKLIAYVDSSFSGVEYLTVFDYLALGRSPHTNNMGKLNTEDKQVIQEVVRELNLVHLIEKDTSEISDGERQLCAVARAIIQSTPIILLDEPTAFLDYLNRQKLIELLVLIAEKQQKTIILSSHDIDICINNALEFLIVSEKKILKTKVSDKQVVIREMEKDVLKSS